MVINVQGLGNQMLDALDRRFQAKQQSFMNRILAGQERRAERLLPHQIAGMQAETEGINLNNTWSGYRNDLFQEMQKLQFINPRERYNWLAAAMGWMAPRPQMYSTVSEDTETMNVLGMLQGDPTRQTPVERVVRAANGETRVSAPRYMVPIFDNMEYER